jgi:hypothetical protein
MRAIARIQMRKRPAYVVLTRCPNLRTDNNFAKAAAAVPDASLRIFRDLIIFPERASMRNNLPPPLITDP